MKTKIKSVQLFWQNSQVLSEHNLLNLMTYIVNFWNFTSINTTEHNRRERKLLLNSTHISVEGVFCWVWPISLGTNLYSPSICKTSTHTHTHKIDIYIYIP